MKLKSNCCKLMTFAAGALLAVPVSSQAAVVFTLQEVGSDVVLSMNAGGTVNTGLLDFQSSYFSPSVGAAANMTSPPFPTDLIILVLGSGSGYDQFSFRPSAISGPSTLGSLFLPPTNATSNTGTLFGMVLQGGTSGGLVLPTGYNSGDPLGAGSSTFAGASFATLGITAGASYVWTFGTNPNTDTLTLNIGGGAAVPESASLLVPTMAISALGLVQLRRRSRRA